jgi:hypothetical protein
LQTSLASLLLSGNLQSLFFFLVLFNLFSSLWNSSISLIFNCFYVGSYGCTAKKTPISKIPIFVGCALPRIYLSTSRLPMNFRTGCCRNTT